MTDDQPKGPWDVRSTPPALRALHKLPPRLADAVLRFCSDPLVENPYA
jgi:mRNA interferase RelE/StbE